MKTRRAKMLLGSLGTVMLLASILVAWFYLRPPRQIQMEAVDVVTALFNGDAHALDGHVLNSELHTLSMTQGQVDRLVEGYVIPHLEHVHLKKVLRARSLASGGMGAAELELELPGGKPGYAALYLFKSDSADIVRITQVVQLVWRVEAMERTNSSSPDPLEANYSGTLQDQPTLEAYGMKGIASTADVSVLEPWAVLQEHRKQAIASREAYELKRLSHPSLK